MHSENPREVPKEITWAANVLVTGVAIRAVLSDRAIAGSIRLLIAWTNA